MTYTKQTCSQINIDSPGNKIPCNKQEIVLNNNYLSVLLNSLNNLYTELDDLQDVAKKYFADKDI